MKLKPTQNSCKSQLYITTFLWALGFYDQVAFLSTSV